MKNLPTSKSWVAAVFLLGCVRLARADSALDAAIQGAWELAETKTTATISHLKTTYPSNYLLKYPTDTTATGTWNTADANSLKGWVSGFFPGTLWLLYQKTGDPQWLQHARDWTAGIEAVKNNPLDHDLGFRFMCSFYNGYRLSTDANDPAGLYRTTASNNLAAAAATLNTRFNKGGIPVGAIKCVDGWIEPYPVIIDTMMNISLLVTAWDLAGRPNSGPARDWFDHAVSHAHKTRARNLRTAASSDPNSRRDGSTYHCVNHNDGTGGRPADGTVLRKVTIQGFSHESTWSRGQAWAIYGFGEIYRQTRDDPSVNPLGFLDAARSTADYFISRLPHNHTADPYNHVLGDFVPPSDFDASLGEPAGPWSAGRAGTRAFTLRDSSAAAIAASGLLQLCQLEPDAARKTTYFLAAENIIRSLLTFTGRDSSPDYLGTNPGQMGLLIGASRLWNDPQKSLIYGDYYLLEALIRYETLRNANESVTAGFTLSIQTVSESGGTLTVPIQLSNPSTLPVTLPFTISGTASSPADYTIPPGPIVIPPGETMGAITIQWSDDLLAEPEETLFLTLETPDQAQLGPNLTHTIVITDDDLPPPSFSGWLGDYFTANERSDSALSGDLADPDGDDIPNLIEYATGLHPRVADADSPALPRLGPAAGSNGTILEFIYERRLDLPDLHYEVETAIELGAWTPATDERMDVQGQVEKRRALLDTAGPFRFIRLKIVRQN